MKIEIRKFFKQTFLPFFLLLLASVQVNAQILTNGDFESGGSGVGFMVHDYTVINPVYGTSTPGTYARTTNPALMNSSYIAGGDHTTGAGNMLVFDGAALANRFFWTTGNTGGAIGGFTAGTTYTFSFWIKSVSNAVVDDATRANIGIFFVNANNINPANQNFLAPLPSEGWTYVAYSFVATANNAMVRLKTNNGEAIGHDFAIDDVSITEGGLEFEGSYTSVNPTCPTSNDGSITVNLTGGTLPYTAYSLTGTATVTNNNGIFANLGEGTYNITVADAVGATFTQTGIVLTAPNSLVVSPDVSICAGDTTPLTTTGGTGSYNWTANPPDDSIANPNAATQNVSPSVTTTYTVTSGSVSDPTNLIENSDFSLGHTGFITEYTHVIDPNPFGVQAAYSIVTNPNAWFTAFTSCGDHTTGTGNLMVFDGSTDPTGNVIVWSNQNPVTVLPNTDYTFSYYVASVSPENPARLEVMINGVSQGAPVTAPGAACLWTQVSYNWNSGANTTANFVIHDRNSASGGNDFALDDITFKEMLTCVYQETVTVTVTAPGTTPTFNPVNPICAGATLTPLPTTSNNGIAGTWSPAPNNMATTTYTFTPNAGQCAATATLTIIVNTSTVPTFNPVAAICAGSPLNPLPTTSTNGITGTWAPALNNNLTTVYTFSPTAGQCAAPTTLTITVNQGNTTPTFNPVAPICAGTTLNPLPTTSTNGINGTWAPALNNTTTTTYTFTPATGQCAATVTLTITVNQPTTVPTFNPVAAICSGETLAALPTISTNGITGTWSPALNNTATTTYTFTPAASQCAVAATLTITVNPATTPLFAPVAAVCAGESLEPLPTTSIDGITGTWLPALNNMQTTTYTFTPNAGQCATTTTLAIIVNEPLDFTIAEGCDGVNYTLSAVQTDPTDSLYAWFNQAGTQIGNGPSVVITMPGKYELVITQHGCSHREPINVLSTACQIQKGISPSNDGLNEYFDLASFNVTQLKIFNRYGTNVYSKANYQNEWRGQSDKGDDLPDGTYYYSIDFADSKTKTGWIYINRMQ